VARSRATTKKEKARKKGGGGERPKGTESPSVHSFAIKGDVIEKELLVGKNHRPHYPTEKMPETETRPSQRTDPQRKGSGRHPKGGVGGGCSFGKRYSRPQGVTRWLTSWKKPSGKKGGTRRERKGEMPAQEGPKTDIEIEEKELG